MSVSLFLCGYACLFAPAGVAVAEIVESPMRARPSDKTSIESANSKHGSGSAADESKDVDYIDYQKKPEENEEILLLKNRIRSLEEIVDHLKNDLDHMKGCVGVLGQNSQQVTKQDQTKQKSQNRHKDAESDINQTRPKLPEQSVKRKNKTSAPSYNKTLDTRDLDQNTGAKETLKDIGDTHIFDEAMGALKSGKPGIAKQLFLKISQNENSSNYAPSLYWLGLIYLHQEKNNREAEKILASACSYFTEKMSKNHSLSDGDKFYYLSSLLKLAQAFKNDGKNGNAKVVLQQLLSIKSVNTKDKRLPDILRRAGMMLDAIDK